MAKRVEVTLVDDTDGTVADETVRFGLDGAAYEIDLSSANADKLRNSLATWIGFAQKVSGSRRSAGARSSGAKSGRSQDSAAIREWARDNGFTVSERGRISEQVRSAYAKANK